jgi:hypothetical protein
MCKSGSVLFEFLPAGELFNIAEAVVRVYHRLGTQAQAAQPPEVPDPIARVGAVPRRSAQDAGRSSGGGGVPLPFDPAAPP